MGVVILFQVIIQQRHASRYLYVKNVRTIIQTPLPGYQYKKQNNAPGKNDNGKKEETQLPSRCTEIEDLSTAFINQETSMVSICVVPVTVMHSI